MKDIIVGAVLMILCLAAGFASSAVPGDAATFFLFCVALVMLMFSVIHLWRGLFPNRWSGVIDKHLKRLSDV